MSKRLRDTLAVLLLSVFLIALALWQSEETAPKAPEVVHNLQSIKDSGRLVVLTLNSPTSYYLDRDGNESGPEFDLINAFAASLGVKAEFNIKNSVGELLDAIESGEADIAAAGLSATEARARRFALGPAYQEVSQQVVCRRGGARPRALKDLQKYGLVVIAGSSYEERLKSLKKIYPDLSWQATEGVSSDQILEKVWLRKLDCTVVDSSIVAINQRYFPELRVRMDLGEKDQLVWVMPKRLPSLKEAADRWFREFRQTDELTGIYERYYGHVELFDYVDTAAFIRRIDSRYERYRPLFLSAAQRHGLSEVLLAAQAYQESHWNPRARSPTGVRGIMMLTLRTAKSVGIKNRLDPKQSIEGGAKYLAKLKRLLSKNVREPDLTWFSLAAYNVGRGHLRDAQRLAVELNKDPYKWHDMKDILPLLSDKRFYRRTKYGYARGSEPVRYVQHVREYEQILLQHLQQPEESVLAEDGAEG